MTTKEMQYCSSSMMEMIMGDGASSNLMCKEPLTATWTGMNQMDDNVMIKFRLKKYKLIVDERYQDNSSSPSYISGATFGDLITSANVIEIKSAGQLWNSAVVINPTGFMQRVCRSGYLATDHAIDFMNIKHLYRLSYSLYVQRGILPTAE